MKGVVVTGRSAVPGDGVMSGAGVAGRSAATEDGVEGVVEVTGGRRQEMARRWKPCGVRMVAVCSMQRSVCIAVVCKEERKGVSTEDRTLFMRGTYHALANVKLWIIVS